MSQLPVVAGGPANQPRDIFAYWRDRRGGRPFPAWSDFNPDQILAHWPNTVLLACDAGLGQPRLAAGFTEALRAAKRKDAETLMPTVKYTPLLTEWLLSLGREVARLGKPLNDSESLPAPKAVWSIASSGRRWANRPWRSITCRATSCATECVETFARGVPAMPIEMRTLAFSRDELTPAITDHAAATGTTLPDGSIMLCAVSDDPDLEVTLKLVPDGQSTIERVTLEADAVGAALVHYCMDQQIPVPQRADRSLQAVGEAQAFRFSINKNAVKIPAFA